MAASTYVGISTGGVESLPREAKRGKGEVEHSWMGVHTT